MEGFRFFLFFTRPRQLTSPIPWTATLVAMEIFILRINLISCLVLYIHSIHSLSSMDGRVICIIYSLEGCSGTRA
jgi:hypothetical protein